MTFFLFLVSALQETAAPVESAPTGLEWMTIASVVVPAVLIAVLLYLGSRRTV